MPEIGATPGQTVGPFFSYGMVFPGDAELVPRGHPQAIRLHGSIYDGAGEPIPDALVEVWQPDGAGRIVHADGSLHRDGWTFTGWGRAATDPVGRYCFTTVAPGTSTDGRGPFFAMTVFARGLLDALFTRAYLPHDDFSADSLLASLDDNRRKTLLCEAEPDGYRFDIRLQGERETVFLGYRTANRP